MPDIFTLTSVVLLEAICRRKTSLVSEPSSLVTKFGAWLTNARYWPSALKAGKEDGPAAVRLIAAGPEAARTGPRSAAAQSAVNSRQIMAAVSFTSRERYGWMSWHCLGRAAGAPHEAAGWWFPRHCR